MSGGEITLNPGERLDDLQTGGLKLIQRPDAFRFGTDSLLLADFAAPRKDEAAVDLLVDGALREEATLAFHPCDNTRTLAMSGRDFFDRFLPAVSATPVDVRFEEPGEDDGR